MAFLINTPKFSPRSSNAHSRYASSCIYEPLAELLSEFIRKQASKRTPLIRADLWPRIKGASEFRYLSYQEVFKFFMFYCY